jgi:hypothetical protein
MAAMDQGIVATGPADPVRVDRGSAPVPSVGGRHGARVLRRIAAGVLAGALVLGAVGCAGRQGRNDDYVGPNGVRPDANRDQ